MTRTDLQQLSELRLREAQLLLDGGSPSGAYYLAGYAVECALKACIAKATVAESFPDKQRANQVHTHDLEALVRLASFTKSLEAAIKANVLLGISWDIVRKWSEASRYEQWDAEEAFALIEAAGHLKNEGVFSCL